MTRNTTLFSLAICCFFSFISLATSTEAQQPLAPKYTAVLTVKHMCCAKESVPAIRELSRVAGVKRVAVDYQTRSLFIEKGDVTPSPQQIWDAASKIKIEPVKLATPEGVYTTRPRR